MERDDMRDQLSSDEELAAFDRQLKAAMRRVAAPAGLKERVLAQSRAGSKTVARAAQQAARPGSQWGWRRPLNQPLNRPLNRPLQRMAASLLLAASVAGAGGGYALYQRAEARKGVEARDQVMAALRITNRTLIRVGDRVNGQ